MVLSIRDRVKGERPAHLRPASPARLLGGVCVVDRGVSLPEDRWSKAPVTVTRSAWPERPVLSDDVLRRRYAHDTSHLPSAYTPRTQTRSVDVLTSAQAGALKIRARKRK